MSRKLYHILLIFMTFTLFSMAECSIAQAQEERHARIRLVPEFSYIEPGQTMYVAIEQTIDAGWHTYWMNPGDSGEAPAIRWTLPEGFEAGAIKWPVPEKIMIGGLGNYGYTGTATLLQEITAPENLPEGPLTLKADIDILVCAEICIPESSVHEITLNDAAASREDNTAYMDDAYNRMPAPFDWYTSYWEDDQENFVMRFELNQPVFVATMSKKIRFDLMMKDWGILDDAAVTYPDISRERILVWQKRGGRPLAALDRLEGLLAYEDREGIRRAVAFTAVPEPEWKARQTAALPAPAPAPQTPAKSHEPIGIILLFALMGGIILNLMPCVFPVLSLKALKLCRMAGKEIAHARIHGILYAAGVMAAFAAFALLLTALKEAGAQIGWGFHLQNPAFVALLACLMFVIGLNLSGLFELRVSIGGKSMAEENGYAASFLTGVLATVVATPCTAPFMGVAMGYALTQGTIITIAVFLTLGFGLALPYLALSFIPALQRALPKPGAWMEKFRHIMAWPMYATAAWLAWVYAQQMPAFAVLWLAAGMLFIAGGILLMKKRKGFLRILGFAALLIAFLPVLSGIRHDPPAQMQNVTEGWMPYEEKSFAALLAGDDPLFVNMTAAWCITCKINEKAVLELQGTKDLFRKNSVRTVMGDWTNYNPEITAYLESFGRKGVPLYVYYGPRDKVTGQRPEPAILPQIVTSGTLEKTIGGKQ